MDKADEMLPIDVFQLAVVIACGQLGAELVAATGKVEVIAFHATAVVGDAVSTAGVAQVGVGEAAGVEGQSFDLVRGQHASAVAGGQQASEVVLQHRQGRVNNAEAQHAVRYLELAGEAHFAEVVHGRPIGALGENTIVAAAAARRVQL
ncbi:hypothetical protein D9M71_449430 [compost metagenome]